MRLLKAGDVAATVVILPAKNLSWRPCECSAREEIVLSGGCYN